MLAVSICHTVEWLSACVNTNNVSEWLRDFLPCSAVSQNNSPRLKLRRWESERKWETKCRPTLCSATLVGLVYEIIKIKHPGSYFIHSKSLLLRSKTNNKLLPHLGFLGFGLWTASKITRKPLVLFAALVLTNNTTMRQIYYVDMGIDFCHCAHKMKL